ncbi:MAG: response regulator transcription factor [Deltaproteobacteria bacterium]
MRLVIIEQAGQINDPLGRILKQRNNSVDVVPHGSIVLELLGINKYDIIIFHYADDSYLGFLQTIRNRGNTTPALVISASGGADNCVQALDNGADDYLCQPCDIEELLARIRALHRRDSEVYHYDEYDMGGCTFLPNQCMIRRNEEMVWLTLKESMILEYLIRNENQVVTKEQLLQRIWGYNCDIEYNNIEVNISHLRKKLSPLKMDAYIQTVRGIGYRFTEGHEVTLAHP